MDYNQAMQQIQAMQMYRRMLGLDQAQGGYGQPQSQMQYAGMAQPGQQQGAGSGGGKSGGMSPTMLTSLMGMMGTKPMVSSGITPTSINKFGDPYQGWSPKTGGYDPMYGPTSEIPSATTAATATPAMYDATLVGSGPAAEAAFGGGSELAGTSGLTAASEVGGAGAGSYLGYIAPVLAAIQGQHMMSSATDRRTDFDGNFSKTSGHRTGDIFSGDFFTEPWMAYAMQQLNVDTPTPGEKTDSALNSIRQGEGGVGELLGSIPGTGLQWFDPFGTAGFSFLEDKLGKEMATVLIPHMGLKNVTDWFSGLF
jgi:hypothetical protein